MAIGVGLQIASALTAGLVLIGLPLAPMLTSDDPDPNQHQPANKTSISGSSLEILSADVTDGSSSDVVELLSTTIKTSKPTDLVIQVTMECALWTSITTVGNDDSSAIATVKTWVEVDGKAVPVSSGESAGSDLGKVVFCNRAYRAVTTDWDDEDAELSQFLATRTSNAFNWITLNVGSATHTIEVFAQLEGQSAGDGVAKAGVGKRTLVVEPMMLSNTATI